MVYLQKSNFFEFFMLLHHEPTYKQAWHHAWRVLVEHKILWPLGLFATFLGQLGLLEFVTKFFTALKQGTAHESWGNLPSTFVSVAGFMTTIRLPFDKWIWAIWLWVIVFGILLLFLFVALVSQGALVYVTGHKLKAKTPVDIGRAWQAGISHFWRLFSVHLVRKTVIITLTILISRATVNALLHTSAVSSLALVVLLFVSVILGFILSCLSIYTIGYIVIEEYGFFQALKGAWILFKEHILVSLEVGFVVLVANIVVAVLACIGVAIFLSPLLLGLLFSGIITSGYIWFAVGVSGIVCSVVYLVALGSFFTILTTSAWTYLFSKMHSHGIESRIVHHLARLIPFKK